MPPCLAPTIAPAADGALAAALAFASLTPMSVAHASSTRYAPLTHAPPRLKPTIVPAIMASGSVYPALEHAVVPTFRNTAIERGRCNLMRALPPTLFVAALVVGHDSAQAEPRHRYKPERAPDTGELSARASKGGDASGSARSNTDARGDCQSAPPKIEAAWPGQASGVPLALGDAGILKLSSCFDSTESVQWTSSGAKLVGSGTRVNFVAEARAFSVEACIRPRAKRPQCAHATYEVRAARPTIQIEKLEVAFEVAGIRWFQIAGKVTNATQEFSVQAFRHTDVFYPADVLTIAADGTFSGAIWAASNVDRLGLLLSKTGTPLTDMEGCSNNFCLGRLDPATKKELPSKIDGASVFASATTYLSGRNSEPADSPSVEELKRAMELSTVSGSRQPARLVRSLRDREGYFLYDQAVAAVAFAFEGKELEARSILNALANVQLPDGSWYFSYRSDGTSIFPAEGDFRYAGAIGWVVIAMNAFHHAFNKQDFVPQADSALRYLQGQMVDVENARAVRFNPSNLAHTTFDETQLTAVEHNLGFFAAIEGFARTTSRRTFASSAAQVRAYIDGRWDGDHFRPGVYLPTGDDRSELYLDTQYLASMAFGRSSPYRGALRFNCRTFGADAGVLNSNALGLHGFSDFKPIAQVSRPNEFVWSEGSLAMVTATRVAHPREGCQGGSFLSGLGALVDRPEEHGFPESTLSDASEYSSSSSAAAAAWYSIALSGKNPLRPWDRPSDGDN
jgi:hypothetical protein